MRAPLQPLVSILATRALASGPQGSREQAGGPLEQWLATWAAASRDTLNVL